MPLPTLSIVTPSYNQAPYLDQTIRSVLDQGYPGIEYRIMDGGSTDGSVEVIRRHEGKLTGWVSEPDAGQADAIARGFALCGGEVLGYINSDDYYLPGALRAAGEAFAADPDLDLLYGDLVFVDPAGEPLVIDVLPDYQWADLARICVIPQPASFWRRRAYVAAGGIDPSFYFSLDYDLFLRMAARGRVRHIPQLMAAFRFHPEAKTSRAQDRRAGEDRLLLRRTLGRDKWNTADKLRLKWLTARQIATIARRKLAGEAFPCLTPARWNRLAKRKLDAIQPIRS